MAGKMKKRRLAMRGTSLNRNGEMDYTVRYAKKAEEFRAQHGPVRILVKDGKPVQ